MSIINAQIKILTECGRKPEERQPIPHGNSPPPLREGNASWILKEEQRIPSKKRKDTLCGNWPSIFKNSVMKNTERIKNYSRLMETRKT